MKVGVLALQGDFRSHIEILSKLNVKTVEVRLPKDLEDCDGLIIPGGESTTIGKLMQLYSLDSAIFKKYSNGMCIYGTCAGAIILAKEIIGSNQFRLRLIDISIERNAYGRQIESFEDEISVDGFADSFKAIFIRAPIIREVGKNVSVLAENRGLKVLCKSEKILVSTFHPELTDDSRIHELFLDMIRKK